MQKTILEQIKEPNEKADLIRKEIKDACSE